MKQLRWLRRDRAPIAVLAVILLAACSETIHEPTSPRKLPGITLRSPAAGFSYQDGAQITVFHDEGGWARLDVAAQTLTNDEGIVIPLTADQTVAFLNDFQGTVVYDNLTRAAQGLSGCGETCIEPTSVGTVPLGTESGSPASGNWSFEVVDTKQFKPKPSDQFGTVVDLDKGLKQLQKQARKADGATILDWPPDCRTALSQVRAASDNYNNNRHSVSQSVMTLFKLVVGLGIPGAGSKVAGQMPELVETFVMKGLAQQNVSFMQAMYTIACGNSIPIGTAGYGWYPGTVQDCVQTRERFSYDGVHYAWATILTCKYTAMH